MWRCVDLASTDVSEERIASIFRGQKSVNREPASEGGSQPINARDKVCNIFNILKIVIIYVINVYNKF
jgi:hypothetical protein